MFRVALTAGLVALAAACSPAATAPTPEEIAAESAKLTAYLDTEFEEELQFSPQWLTRLGRKEQYDQLGDASEAQADRELDWRRESVAEMKAQIDYARLSPAAQTSFDIWELELAREEEARSWRHHNYLFARGGPHTGLPNFLINFHKVDEPSDMEAYVSRVGQIGVVIGQIQERAKLAAEGGVRQPQFAYDQSIDEIGRVTAGAPFGPGAPSPLYADALAKIAALQVAGKIDAVAAEAFRAQVAAAMTDKMKPAYDALAAWLRADREMADTVPQGVSALPDGGAYYDYRLKQQTTTSMTAEEIHQLGLAEVARIRDEMEVIRQAVGFNGTLEAFFEFMRTDKQFYLPNTDAGRADYLAQADGYLSAMKAKLPEYFGRLPKSELVVRRVEAFREEDGGAAHYMSGAPDGTRPGVFYAHLSDMNAVATFQLEALAYHEGVPGHHMQRSVAMEMTGLPVFRTQYSYTAYTEGWALYTEGLGKDMGFFTNPYNDFGRLSSEMWRAIRLVVDTGLHAKGWSQEQAEAYALANSPRPVAAVRSEVRRYLVSPGQATTYKIGAIGIARLRDEAKAALGDRFDWRGFHDTVLEGGALPMPVLEKRVRAWIAVQKAA